MDLKIKKAQMEHGINYLKSRILIDNKFEINQNTIVKIGSNILKLKLN